MLTVKIRQRERSDCGVACAAMAAGVSYETALSAFTDARLHKKRGRRHPFASNYADLARVLAALGCTIRRHRFTTWDDLPARAILKVHVQRNGNWHWVVAERHPDIGWIVLDPALELSAMERPPEDVLCLDFSKYRPQGLYLQLPV